MRALQAICIVGAITFTGLIHQVAHTPGVTVPDEMQEAVVSVETPAWPALSAAVPEAPAGPETVPWVASRPLVTAKAEIGDDPEETKSVDLGQHDAARPVPATRDASNDAPNPARVAQDFRYLIYFYCVINGECRRKVFRALQHGHRGNVRMIALMKRLRMVAIEFGT